MRFFFDRCTPIALAKMVRAIDGDVFTISHLDEDDRFDKRTPDTEWIQALCKDGQPLWVVISGDGAILRNKAERKVLDEVRLPYFCLDGSWQDHKIHEQAWRFMKVWSQIVEAARQKKHRLFRVRCGNKLKVEAID